MAKNRLFPLTLQTIDAKCLKDNVQDDSWCWHIRFGHLNFKTLKSMEDKNMVAMEYRQSTIQINCVKLFFMENMQGGVL